MSTAPYVLGGIAAVALIKTFFRPFRAVVREGAVQSCPGVNSQGACDPSLVIAAKTGTEAYSVVSGRVVAVGDYFLHIASIEEPVVLMYEGVTPSVVEGQYVGRGEGIGVVSGPVYFSVTEWMAGGKDASGTMAPVYARRIDPASWLASRGQKIAWTDTGDGTAWCEQGRSIDVPAAAGLVCNLYAPDKGAFALLPVSISVER